MGQSVGDTEKLKSVYRQALLTIDRDSDGFQNAKGIFCVKGCGAIKDMPEIKKQILLNIPYFMFFWLGGKLAQAYRLAPSSDISAKVINIRMGFAYAFDSLAPSFYPQDVFFGLATAVVIWLVVWSKKKNAKKFRKDVEHGSARWSA